MKLALALTLLITQNMASADDSDMSEEEQGYARDAIAYKVHEAFASTRAIEAALPNTVIFLDAPDVDEVQ